MKVIILIAFALFALALAVPQESEIVFQFGKFVQKHGRQYQSDEEFGYRYRVFKKNYLFIDDHNTNQAATKGFTVAVNSFADLTNSEFRERYLGVFNNASRVGKNRPLHTTPKGFSAPASVDWRTAGVVTPIKNQGQCGSCWSFSTTGSVEGIHALKTKQLVSLSEKNLMDCSTKYGNQGCNGGLMDYAFQYIIDNAGVDTEKSYPYKPQDGKCQFNKKNVGATITGFHDVPSQSESGLLSAVAQQPVSVAIDASHSSFQFYSTGVYYEPQCSQTELDHGVLAVGYGTSSGSDYWLVKNSWGTDWGLSGYINMARNKNNNCGIATSASYPTA